VDKKPNHSRKLDTQGARRLIFLLAASTTLSFWAIFANKIDLDQSAIAGSENQASGDASLVQDGNQLSLILPPMPTLIPPLASSAVSLQLPLATSLNPVSLPQSGTLYLGGTKPNSGSVAPAPIAKSRSSH
jgi:hypothetical protein